MTVISFTDESIDLRSKKICAGVARALAADAKRILRGGEQSLPLVVGFHRNGVAEDDIQVSVVIRRVKR